MEPRTSLAGDGPGVHHETLEEETKHLLEEACMVLPGIQALFGFQLVVVPAAAAGLASMLGVGFYGLWFGLPAVARARRWR